MSNTVNRLQSHSGNTVHIPQQFTVPPPKIPPPTIQQSAPSYSQITQQSTSSNPTNRQVFHQNQMRTPPERDLNMIALLESIKALQNEMKGISKDVMEIKRRQDQF